jgi:hypothetical protein
MADEEVEETRTIIVTQRCAESFSLSGSEQHPPMQHRVQADMVHHTDKPVVHMHLWNEECVGKLDVQHRSGTDTEQPFHVAHRFDTPHAQTHEMQTSLAAPIHHALQMRTPLQIRFCNTWQVASDYSVQVALRGRPFLDIRLTGATVATPQPCPDDDCAPDPKAARHP